MFDGLIAFGHSLASFLTPESVFFALASSLVGVIIGALPGLTATMGVALMTTLTIKLPSDQALLILVCTYVGAIYGGSRSAILLNIPGTPASAASCLDGYALARQGHAGRAMGIATSGSVLGTLIGMFFLAWFTPVLGDVALKFGAYEFFWLSIFGVIISATLTGGDALKGWITGIAGLFIATIGQDGIHAYERFSFDLRDLAGGFSLVPALVGAFGFAEILVAMRERRPVPKINPFDTVIPRISDVLQYRRTIVRSGVIGTFVGIVPGVGEDVAAWSSYAAAKRASKEREKFGKGSVEGLMAAETGDNACVPGAIIPVLTLQIPGSAPAAVLMAAMLIHGVKPGPMIMVESPQFVYDIVAMMLIATLGILLYGLTLTKLLVQVLKVPTTIIVPMIFVLCVVGTYALAQRLFDVWTMLGFGVLGYLLRRYGFPVAPLVLGIVLGDLMEKNLRRGLVLSDGDLTPFFTRPISAVLFGVIVLVVLLRVPAIRRRLPWARMRLALCNEVLAPLDFESQCRMARAMGYSGLELAPYTVAERPETLGRTQARTLRAVAADHGLEITGLHWLLVQPAGLSITSADEVVQRRTVDFMRRLCEFCAALGGRYLVHGSPAQRRPQAGQSPADALARATAAWAVAGEAAGRLGLSYCIEPLSRDQTPLVNTVAEAVDVVRAVGLPGLRTMIDTSSAGLAETEPVPALIRRWWPTGLLAHIQLNDPNRRGPGQGAMAFGPVLQALREVGYGGVLAVEPFDYQPDGPACAARAAGYLQGLLEMQPGAA